MITKTRPFKYKENLTPETKTVQINNSDIFHISAQNIDCGKAGLTSTHNLCF